MSIYQKLSLEDAKLAVVKMSGHLTRTQGGDCRFIDYERGERGYAQQRFRGVKYYCHILSAMAHLGRAPAEGEEVSHLCHNPACVEPMHLVYEDGMVNKSRLCCKLFAATRGYKCPHQPTCFGCQAVEE